ncbi:MAG: hypothetical protein HZB35_04710 [Nitrospirae bacterium]|nr:hypothetical protein [Nitrospirota bacterium]
MRVLLMAVHNRKLSVMRDPAPLLVPRKLATALLQLYDFPHPRISGRVIRGYDRPHALRTARMCAAVAASLGHPDRRVRDYQIACLLHDLGRAGLDRRLFGAIWSWARTHGIPTRPQEWRAVHPETRYGRETEAFVCHYRDALKQEGIVLDAWAKEQVEMRLGYARRLHRQLRRVKPRLSRLGVRWAPWMTRVMLYYYYPERLAHTPAWVRQLGEIMVACEQFEAYSNRQRGQDYYIRNRESLGDAIAYLDKLEKESILSATVVGTLKKLAAGGAFDRILAESRRAPLSSRERAYLRSLNQGVA